MYGGHFARRRKVLEIGVNLGVLEKSGAWYIHNGDRLGRARTTRAIPEGKPQLAREIEAKIREKAASPSPLRPPGSRQKKKRLSTSPPASAAELRQRALRLSGAARAFARRARAQAAPHAGSARSGNAPGQP